MSNRNNNGSDYTNPNNRNSAQNHVKNTDNEKTQYFSASADNMNTAEFNASGYNNGERRSSGRQQYYKSYDSQNAQQPNANQRQSNNNERYRNSANEQYTRYDQYGNPVYNEQQPQYDQYGNPIHKAQPPQLDQYGNPIYNAQPRPRYDQYGNPIYNAQQRPRQNQNGQPQYRTAQPNTRGRYANNGGNQSSNRPNQGRTAPPNNQRQRNGYNEAPQQRRTSNNNQPPTRQRKTASPKPKRRRKSILLKIIMLILLLILIIFGVYSCTSISLIKKLNYVESGERSHVSGALDASYVTSVLLIGTDGRSLDDRGRSDTMILLSINKKTNKITLTSFMRDSCVQIPGYGEEKLNAAYSYGGPDLLMDTIEQNFSVRVDDYISVNFVSFASIIDSVGGIEIEVSDSEAQEINTILMAEVNEIMGDPVDSDLLSGGGKLELDGKQALSYARIRHIGNADFERTERQRNVLTQVAGKLKSLNPSMISKIANNAVPQITTNMTQTELYLLSLRLPFFIRYDINQLRIPAEGTYGNVTTSSGGAALSVDFDTNYNLIKEEVFGS